MKIRFRLLIVAFAACFLLVCLLSAISIGRFSSLSDRVSAVEHSYQVANVIMFLDEQVRDLDRNEFQFLVTGDSIYFKGYEDAASRINRASDSLRRLTRDNAENQRHLILFKSDMALYMKASRLSMADLISDSGIHRSRPYRDSRDLMVTATRRLSGMADEEDRLLVARMAERENYRQVTSDMIRVLGITFSGLTLLLFFMLLQEFRKRVRFQGELQQKMMEIAQTKQELEHIAYATSHDLQEPLRKIRILTDKWKHQQRTAPLNDDTINTLDRVTAAVTKMQALVSELMVLTTLHDGRPPVPCPIAEFVQNAITGLDEQVREKGALIEVRDLPLIEGYPDQLRILFRNLLDNSLKFARPEETPVITISTRAAKSDELDPALLGDRNYHCISIHDNGIGFNNKTADKMFGIFRQLHTRPEGYQGKGTGLAICHRIMTNHKGHIIAHGFPGAGATFKLYFPA